MNIPITKAIIDEADHAAIIKPLKTGWLVQGPNVAEFEKLFAEFTYAKYAKAVSNCTTALHLALDALGVKAGDKVVVPSFTFIASANAVEYTGAEVVFCDIDLNTFNIDVQQLEALLKKDKAIKAVMPVHLFGLCADMPAVMKLAHQYQVKVVEDAACAFDAWIGDVHAGLFGDAGCFSFHPRKSITTGEGGMLVTGNKELFDVVKQLCDHGGAKSDLQRHQEKGGSRLPDYTMRGYNYRMTDMQGALGVSQIKKADLILQGRRQIAAWYDNALQAIPELLIPTVPKEYKHGYQSYVCLFTGGESLDQLSLAKIDRINTRRNHIMDLLEEKGVATRQGTHAVHTLGHYQNKYHLHPESFIKSYAADRLSITLPVYAGMTRTEFDYVIQNIKESIRQCAG